MADSYDALVIAGGMGENQIPCVALHEMIRLVKPGKMREKCYAVISFV